MSWEYFDEERVVEKAVESFDFDDWFDVLDLDEYEKRRVVDEDDEEIGRVEETEEAALVELWVLGCIEFEFGYGHTMSWRDLGMDEVEASWEMFEECDEYIPFDLY